MREMQSELFQCNGITNSLCKPWLCNKRYL